MKMTFRLQDLDVSSFETLPPDDVQGTVIGFSLSDHCPTFGGLFSQGTCCDREAAAAPENKAEEQPEAPIAPEGEPVQDVTEAEED